MTDETTSLDMSFRLTSGGTSLDMSFRLTSGGLTAKRVRPNGNGAYVEESWEVGRGEATSG
jgi:hypothetical protein